MERAVSIVLSANKCSECVFGLVMCVCVSISLYMYMCALTGWWVCVALAAKKAEVKVKPLLNLLPLTTIVCKH